MAFLFPLFDHTHRIPRLCLTLIYWHLTLGFNIYWDLTCIGILLLNCFFVCHILDLWYNIKLKHSWQKKGKGIFLCILICVWTILASSQVRFVISLDRSICLNKIVSKNDTNEYPNIFVSKTVQMNIRIYSYRKIIKIWYLSHPAVHIHFCPQNIMQKKITEYDTRI